MCCGASKSLIATVPARSWPGARTPARARRGTPGGRGTRSTPRGGLRGCACRASRDVRVAARTSTVLTACRLALSTSVGVIAAERGGGALEARRAAKDAGVARHDPLELLADLGARRRRHLGRRVRRVGRPRRRAAPRSRRACPSRLRWPRPRAREHEPFEQRVRRQAVGAVHAGARGLAAGPEARQRGGAVEVGAHTTGQVVGGGRDREPVVRRIEADGAARLPDGREAGRELVDAGGVEPEVLEVALDEPSADRLGDDVARCEVGERVLAAP